MAGKKQQKYYNDVYNAAKSLGANHVQASLAASQSSIETGYGKHIKGNSYFGVKASPKYTGETTSFTTHEVIGGTSKKMQQVFRAYPGMKESVADYMKVMAHSFPKAWEATSLPTAIKGLGEGKFGRYATDPKYENKIGWVTNNFKPESPAPNKVASVPTPRPSTPQPQVPSHIGLLEEIPDVAPNAMAGRTGVDAPPSAMDSDIGKLRRDAAGAIVRNEMATDVPERRKAIEQMPPGGVEIPKQHSWDLNSLLDSMEKENAPTPKLDQNRFDLISNEGHIPKEGDPDFAIRQKVDSIMQTDEDVAALKEQRVNSGDPNRYTNSFTEYNKMAGRTDVDPIEAALSGVEASSGIPVPTPRPAPAPAVTGPDTTPWRPRDPFVIEDQQRKFDEATEVSQMEQRQKLEQAGGVDSYPDPTEGVDLPETELSPWGPETGVPVETTPEGSYNLERELEEISGTAPAFQDYHPLGDDSPKPYNPREGSEVLEPAIEVSGTAPAFQNYYPLGDNSPRPYNPREGSEVLAPIAKVLKDNYTIEDGRVDPNTGVVHYDNQTSGLNSNKSQDRIGGDSIADRVRQNTSVARQYQDQSMRPHNDSQYTEQDGYDSMSFSSESSYGGSGTGAALNDMVERGQDRAISQNWTPSTPNYETITNDTLYNSLPNYDDLGGEFVGLDPNGDSANWDWGEEETVAPIGSDVAVPTPRPATMTNHRSTKPQKATNYPKQPTTMQKVLGINPNKAGKLGKISNVAKAYTRLGPIGGILALDNLIRTDAPTYDQAMSLLRSAPNAYQVSNAHNAPSKSGAYSVHTSPGGRESTVSGKGNYGAGSYSVTTERDDGGSVKTARLGAGTSNPGGQANEKIVCTAMNDDYGFGSYRNAIWLKYAEDNLTPEHQVGYHAIFRPLLKLGRTQKGFGWLYSALKHIARHRSVDLRSVMKGGKRDKLGRAYRAILEPICYITGKIIGDKS